LRGKEKTIAKRQAICTRALGDFESWLEQTKPAMVA
jgi:hypothetical protein